MITLCQFLALIVMYFDFPT